MSFAQTPIMSLRRRLSAIGTSCHRLIQAVSDPYRPELHYMRGPGPKWHARHGKSNNSAL